jgi:hypothetical protein
VCVHHLRAMPKDRSAQDACGDEIELAARGRGDHVETAVPGTASQLVAVTSNDDGVMSALSHAGREPEGLALTPPPPTLRIDVEDR